MDRNILLVAIGGCFGSVLRYVISVAVAERAVSSFPYGTLIVNVAGCFLIGLFVALSEKGNIITPEWRILLTTGFCGGFTTLSTFSYESIRLIQDGELLYLSVYVVASILAGLGATYAGMSLIKAI
jgi:CrcB protein